MKVSIASDLPLVTQRNTHIYTRTYTEATVSIPHPTTSTTTADKTSQIHTTKFPVFTFVHKEPISQVIESVNNI